MKKIAFVLMCMVVLCGTAYAADFSSINADSIAAFIELMPQYKALAEKYGSTVNELNALPTTQEFMNEAEKLFGRYGTTFQQFPLFMQKVSVGLAQVAMQNSGMQVMPGMFGGVENLSDDEIKVMKSKSEELQALFDAL